MFQRATVGPLCMANFYMLTFLATLAPSTLAHWWQYVEGLKHWFCGPTMALIYACCSIHPQLFYSLIIQYWSSLKVGIWLVSSDKDFMVNTLIKNWCENSRLPFKALGFWFDVRSWPQKWAAISKPPFLWKSKHIFLRQIRLLDTTWFLFVSPDSSHLD